MSGCPDVAVARAMIDRIDGRAEGRATRWASCARRRAACVPAGWGDPCFRQLDERRRSAKAMMSIPP